MLLVKNRPRPSAASNPQRQMRPIRRQHIPQKLPNQMLQIPSVPPFLVRSQPKKFSRPLRGHLPRTPLRCPVLTPRMLLYHWERPRLQSGVRGFRAGKVNPAYLQRRLSMRHSRKNSPPEAEDSMQILSRRDALASQTSTVCWRPRMLMVCTPATPLKKLGAWPPRFRTVAHLQSTLVLHPPVPHQYLRRMPATCQTKRQTRSWPTSGRRAPQTEPPLPVRQPRTRPAPSSRH